MAIGSQTAPEAFCYILPHLNFERLPAHAAVERQHKSSTLAVGTKLGAPILASNLIVRHPYASRAARSSTILAILLCTLSPATKAFAQVQAETIIQRSVEANQQDWKADPEYNFFERDLQQNGSRTHEVMMIEGSPLLPPDGSQRSAALQRGAGKRGTEAAASHCAAQERVAAATGCAYCQIRAGPQTQSPLDGAIDKGFQLHPGGRTEAWPL